MKRVKGCLLLLLFLLLGIAAFFILSKPALCLAGRFLVSEDPLEKADVIFVLSGDAWDRGNEAVKLFQRDYAPVIICTGENIPHNLKALDIEMPESRITAQNIINQGVADSVVLVIEKGTSTFEESAVILDYCLKNKVEKCIIVSSKFHTRRINITFKEKFREQDIRYMIHGAPSTLYFEDHWWENEYGLIALNNEYIKLAYYWLKY